MIRTVTQADTVVQLDLSEQVLGVDAPESVSYGWPGEADYSDRVEIELSPFPRDSETSFVSAAVLGQKAKQFDDNLLATLEVAAQRGSGTFPSKADFLQAWAASAIRAGVKEEGVCVLLAACRLGTGSLPEVSRDLARCVNDQIDKFLADKKRSVPLGFYTNTPQLTQIFLQDRMLMTD